MSQVYFVFVFVFVLIAFTWRLGWWTEGTAGVVLHSIAFAYASYTLRASAALSSDVSAVMAAFAAAMFATGTLLFWAGPSQVSIAIVFAVAPFLGGLDAWVILPGVLDPGSHEQVALAAAGRPSAAL